MDNFKLTKLKMRNDLGVEITYNEKVVSGKETHWVEKIIKSSIHRHPDMDAMVKKFKIHVARLYGLLAIGMYKKEEDMTDTEKKLLEQVNSEMEITGVNANHGDDGEISLIITAVREVLDGKRKVVMNTPLIKTTEEELYPECYEMGQTFVEVQEEAFQYIFKRKFAQLDLFSAKEAEESGDDEGISSDEEQKMNEKLSAEKKSFKRDKLKEDLSKKASSKKSSKSSSKSNSTKKSTTSKKSTTKPKSKAKAK